MNGGSGWNFVSYNGTTSQVFTGTEITVSGADVLLSIGGDVFTYIASTSGINSGDSLTFTDSNGYSLVLIYQGGGINNGNSSANAADLQSSVMDFFQIGSILTAGNLGAKIGSPTVNGGASNLMSVIGGVASDLAGQLGDPVTGTFGLPRYIRNNGAAVGTVNGFDASSFDNATTLYDQINAFLSTISQSNSVATNNIMIPKGTYTDLRSLLAALNHD